MNQIVYSAQNIHIVLEELMHEKRRINPRFSYRSLARTLKIDQSQLSRLIKRENRLTPIQAYRIAIYLKLSRDHMLDFIISTFEGEDLD